MALDNIVVDRVANPYSYSVEARSDIGSREQQQDQAYLHIGKERLFAVVCDGMGGALDGGIASKVAVSIIQRLYADHYTEEADESAFLYRAMVEADRAVSAKMTHGIGGTTLVSAVISKNQMHWVSVGDSRLYIIRAGKILQATRDHNYRLRLDEMLRGGDIGPDEYEKEMERGDALISYIGKGNITLYDLTQSAFTLQQGDTILITTDGLTSAVSKDTLLGILSSKNSTVMKANSLIQYVRDKGTEHPQDNATFIIIDICNGGKI